MSPALEAWRVTSHESTSLLKEENVDKLRFAILNLMRCGAAVVMKYEDYRRDTDLYIKQIKRRRREKLRKSMKKAWETRRKKA